ncbi:E3 ubiquitin-protein ligase UPL3-like isoform X2 [Nicotiana tabacum]|uniref:E3 ubiquitin-protein ligase UPL3-like isoform X2 n=1 Tax=Nicotiana tabacum TaxID=4097 RepID=A0AC58RNJ5_TOBAC
MKISQEHPTACLRAGALMAVLSYLDFFSTGVQRVALATAANMCKKLPSDAADFVMEAVPLLTNLLQYHDAKIRRARRSIRKERASRSRLLAILRSRAVSGSVDPVDQQIQPLGVSR